MEVYGRIPKLPTCEADWLHRDCIEGQCFWMMSDDICQSCRREAEEIDPSRTMPIDEIEAVIAKRHEKPDDFVEHFGLLVMRKDA